MSGTLCVHSSNEYITLDTGGDEIMSGQINLRVGRTGSEQLTRWPLVCAIDSLIGMSQVIMMGISISELNKFGQRTMKNTACYKSYDQSLLCIRK